jgi:hypothetical protein
LPVSWPLCILQVCVPCVNTLSSAWWVLHAQTLPFIKGSASDGVNMVTGQSTPNVILNQKPGPCLYSFQSSTLVWLLQQVLLFYLQSGFPVCSMSFPPLLSLSRGHLSLWYLKQLSTQRLSSILILPRPPLSLPITVTVMAVGAGCFLPSED